MDPHQNKYEVKIIHEGKWLIYKTVQFKSRGKDCTWEMVERPWRNNIEPSGVDTIPIVKRQGQKDQLLLIASFRIPLMKYILEFPSGMMDDQSIEGNATRELKEETGYTGVVHHFEQHPTKFYTDPWKSPETGHFLIYQIDGDAPENQQPQQSLEPEEDIKVVMVDFDENLYKTLTKLKEENNYEIYSSVWAFAIGLGFKNIMNT